MMLTKVDGDVSTLLTRSFCVVSNTGNPIMLLVKRNRGFVECPPYATNVLSKKLENNTI